MQSQRKLVQKTLKRDQFTLIILDACRYDIFTWFNNIDGIIRKVRTAATHTYVWFKRVFTGYYPDVTVFSQHPVLNSYGYTPSRWIPAINRHTFDSSVANKWKSTEHFEKIIDLWDADLKAREWDAETWKVDLEPFFDYILKCGLDKKNILWCMTIHHPYIGEGKNEQEKYINGVKKTLKKVKEFLQQINRDNVIITADHGDIFEPNSHFGIRKPGNLHHAPGIDDRRLLNVPWFEVK